MVRDSRPDVSDMRLAARPVGAASSMRARTSPKSLIMALMMVVLPVPGPPVSTIILLRAAVRTASSCSAAREMFSSPTTLSTSASGFSNRTDLGERKRRWM